MALIETLARAGIKRNLKSFVGLFLLMALSSGVLCFTIGMYVDLNAREAQAMAEAKAGDVYAYDLETNLTDEVVSEIRSLDEVEEVGVSRSLRIPLRFFQGGEVLDKTPDSSPFLTAWGEGLQFQVFAEGEASFVQNPTAPGKNEAYVPLSWSTMLGVKPGDEIELQVGSETKLLTVAAFFEDPQLGTTFIEIKRMLLAPETFDELASWVDAYSEGLSLADAFYDQKQMVARLVDINVFLSPEARAAGVTSSDLAALISEETAWGNQTPGMFSATTLAGYAMMMVVVGSAIMGVFALLLFVIALVICTHAISSSIEQDYADYGILNALGIPRRTQAVVLVIEYATASFAGLVVGYGLSLALVPIALVPFAPLVGVLATHAPVSAAAVACLTALLLVVIAVIALKTRKLARISPLVALRGGASDVRFASRLARPLTARFLNAQLAFRAVVSAKRRYVSLFACSLLLCAFVVLVFGIGARLSTSDSVMSTFGMWKSDVTVRLGSPDVSIDEVEEIIEEKSPIAKKWREIFTMVNFAGESRSFVGLSDLSIIQGVAEGRVPKLNNEVMIGPNLAREQNLALGDEFVIDINGKERTLLVCGMISGMFNAGYGSLMTYEGLCEILGKDPDDSRMAWQYALSDPGAAEDARNALEAAFDSKIEARPSGLFGDTTAMFDLVQTLFLGMAYLMAAVAVLLVFLAVSLITSRMFAAEHQDLGIYRALGFTARRLRLQFALRFLMVSLAGCVLGAVSATLFGGQLISQLFGLFGVTQFELGSTPLVVAGVAVGLALMFFVAAYACAHKIKRVDVRELVAE